MLFFENSRGTLASSLWLPSCGDLLFGCFFGGLGLLGGFLRALVGLGRALLLAGSFFERPSPARPARPVPNGGGFGGVGGRLRSSWWCLSFRRLIRA